MNDVGYYSEAREEFDWRDIPLDDLFGANDEYLTDEADEVAQEFYDLKKILHYDARIGIYQKMADASFPKPINLGARAVG